MIAPHSWGYLKEKVLSYIAICLIDRPLVHSANHTVNEEHHTCYSNGLTSIHNPKRLPDNSHVSTPQY